VSYSECGGRAYGGERGVIREMIVQRAGSRKLLRGFSIKGTNLILAIFEETYSQDKEL
jgi:hypothetical protein